MGVAVSVVVPFYNARDTLADCLGALARQNLSEGDYEIVAVDDGSTDGGARETSRYRARCVQQDNRGAPAARNRGVAAAAGDWVAFTDADCIPTRGWLRSLLRAAHEASATRPALGAAGPMVGFRSDSDAARYVDLSGGLRADRHLAHPRFPFAPTGNAMYRRSVFERVGGFDPRFDTYDACDLHTRLLDQERAPFPFVPEAVVLHRHRDTWAGYWRQQRGYGRGLGQFYWHYRDRICWSARREAAAWAGLAPLGVRAILPTRGEDDGLLRRGHFLKHLAQRVGFVERYWSLAERQRWRI